MALGQEMMKRRQRAYAYITNQGRLLLFRQPAYPEAGIQVPAGTVRPGEHAKSAVLREAEEETGLTDLQFVEHIGSLERDMTEFGTREIQDAQFFHVRCPGTPPDEWSHDETSGGTVDPIRFDFFWATLPDGIPELIALNGVMLDKLNESMSQEAQQSHAEATSKTAPFQGTVSEASDA